MRRLLLSRPVMLVVSLLMVVPLFSGLAVQTASAAPVSVASSQTTINFENQPVSSEAQTVTIGIATFSGGMIVSDLGTDPADETHVYWTADSEEGCINCSPSITVAFAQPVTNFSADVVNGENFQVTYTVSSNSGASQTHTLPEDFNSGKARFSLAVSGITSVTVSQPDQSKWDFEIDNVSFTVPPPPSGVDYYAITVRAWIPSNKLPDPASQLFGRFPEVLAQPSANFSLCNVAPSSISYVTSYFKGDAHTGYGDPYRVAQSIIFDWNGHTVSNLHLEMDQGITHREITVYLKNGGQKSCEQIGADTPTGTAASFSDSGVFGIGASAGFNSTLAASNPLGKLSATYKSKLVSLQVAPPILVNLTGTFSAKGALTISYSTTNYPSIGIEVEKNSHDVGTKIINDGSCLNGSELQGLMGDYQLLTGLGPFNQNNNGSFTVGSRNWQKSIPSSLCSPFNSPVVTVPGNASGFGSLLSWLSHTFR